MHFGNPQALWLLPAWPLLALLARGALAWRRRAEQRLGQPGLLGRLHPASVIAWRRRRLGLLLAAALLLTIAASLPQYGRVVETIRSVGVNVLVAIDCSNSMRARDGAPVRDDQPSTRIEYARENLKWLIRQLPGNRVGIVSFAGDAFLQCPLTLDHDLASIVLDAIDTDTVGMQGTDLGRAIDAAVDAFDRGAEDGGRALVLITDGEDNEGKGLEAARRAADKRVAIYAIGIGSARGAPILDEKGQFMEDAGGAKVNSKLSMDTLDRIARATGGGAFPSDGPLALTAERIAERIRKQEQVEMESRREVMYQDRFQWFLAAALALLVWALWSQPEPTRLDERTAGPSPAHAGRRTPPPPPPPRRGPPTQAPASS